MAACLSRSKPRKPQPLLPAHHPGSNLFIRFLGSSMIGCFFLSFNLQ
jgi:hypothetical protein